MNHRPEVQGGVRRCGRAGIGDSGPVVVAVVEALKGHPLFAHVTLTRSERSPIAALVTDLLEGIEV